MFDILIVEDDPSTKVALPVVLKLHGFTSILVDNVNDAIEALKLEPKFILLDLALNGSDGIEVLRHIKSNSLKVKCAVTTGYSINGSEVFDCVVLRKPIDLDELLTFLNN